MRSSPRASQTGLTAAPERAQSGVTSDVSGSRTDRSSTQRKRNSGLMPGMGESSRQRATRAAKARQLSGRRRFVDPTTCERDYSQAELEFMLAMNEYKHKSGRMFPTWSEILEVLRNLGYEKIETPR